MVIQLCEYTKNCWIVYFKRVKCMIYELHLNEAVKSYAGEYVKQK